MADQRSPRLALVDPSGRLRLVAVHESGTATDVVPPLDAAAVEDGPLPRLLWPAWLDRERLAVSATTPTGRPALYLIAPDVSGATLLYRPPPGLPPEIAPGVPHYANPSPNGRHICVATPGDRALRLLLVDAELRGDPPEILRGAPVFTAWSPGGDTLLIHSGSVVQRLERGDAESLTTVALNSVDFRVPAWSPDSALIATIRHGEIRNAVVLLDRDGKHVARVGAVTGSAALAWSPDGGLLAVSRQTMIGAFDGIDLIDVRTSEMRPLVKESLLLWLWSPDGRRIAYLRRVGGEGALCWRVVHLDGRPTLTSAPFHPGPLFAVLLAFFDQYLLSQRLWSPDGRYLIATGRTAGDGPPREIWGNTILLFDTAGGRPLSALCPGEIGTWQP